MPEGQAVIQKTTWHINAFYRMVNDLIRRANGGIKILKCCAEVFDPVLF